MQKTSIEWTDLSWNPIRARRLDGKHRIPGHFCQKISAGCGSCYASKTQARFGMATFPGTSKSAADVGVEPFLDDDALRDMLNRRKPAKVFVCDMSDLFGAWVPFEWIDRIFAVMALTPHIMYQVLTKRPERMAEYLLWVSGSHPLDADRKYCVWSAARVMIEDAVNCGTIRRIFKTPDHTKMFLKEFEWPPPNVWLGTSVEDQANADKRIPELLKVPATVRFLSCEPLLSSVSLREDWLRPVTPQAGGISWVIVGGESGPHARPMHPQWARDIRDQCAAAGVAHFFKQWGEWASGDQSGEQRAAVARIHKNNRHDDVIHIGLAGSQDPFLPANSNMETLFRVGKSAAGRLLDGREHSEFPKIGAT